MKRNGFTLIEIIICIALLSVIALISIVSLNISKNSEIEKEDKHYFEDAIIIGGEKLNNEKKLNTYSDFYNVDSNTDSFYCLSKETIINEGMINENDPVLKTIKEDDYVKVIKDDMGLYTLLTDASVNDCLYLKSEIFSANVVNSDAKIIDKLSEEENGYYIKQQVIQDDNIVNNYKYYIDFILNAGKLNQSVPDIYTIFILDASASMCPNNSNCNKTNCMTNGSKYAKSIDAIISLSNKLTSKNNISNNKNYISLISFSSAGVAQPTVVNGFRNTSFAYKDFTYNCGRTHYFLAFKDAYNLIKDLNKDNKRFFILFLTDGGDVGNSDKEYYDTYKKWKYTSAIGAENYTSYLDDLKEFLEPDDEKEYGKLIAINLGYHTGGELFKETLESIASEGCGEENSECYYYAETSTIENVYSNFLNVIDKEVICSTFEKVKVSINLNENFQFNDGSKNKVIEKNIECDENNFTTVTQTQKIVDNALYDIKFEQPDVTKLSEGNSDFNIIENISIDFFDKNGSKVHNISFNSSDFPKVTLNIEKISVIN